MERDDNIELIKERRPPIDKNLPLHDDNPALNAFTTISHVNNLLEFALPGTLRILKANDSLEHPKKLAVADKISYADMHSYEITFCKIMTKP